MRWIFDIAAIGTSLYLLSSLWYGIRKHNFFFSITLGVLIIACIICAFKIL